MNDIISIDCTKHLKYCFSRPFQHLNPDGIYELDKMAKHYAPLTPDVDPDFLRNDWGVIAARAFSALKMRNVPVKSSVIIGTGIGLDALGLIECFSPSSLVITDLSQQEVEAAKFNVLKNITEKIKENEIIAIEANLFSHHYFCGRKFDLIFENLPNLPYQREQVSDQPLPGSFYQNQFPDVPHIYKNNLLVSHYDCLSRAKNHLNSNGGIICNIGTRVPINTILSMFHDLGYQSHILVYDFKCQNEGLINLQAYADWEACNPIRFDFFPYQETLNILKNNSYDKITGYSLSDQMKFPAISATEAYLRLKNNPKERIGHFFCSIYATLKN